MALYSESLFTMRNAVKQVKPNASQELIDRSINKRIRTVIIKRYWSDLLRLGFITVPDQYTTGTITTTLGSPIVTGAGTNWPVNDLVNTVLPNPIKNPGMQGAPIGDLRNIKIGSWLLIEPGQTNEEAVAVADIFNGQIIANFQKTHDANAAVTASTLVGLQLRVTYNPYTVIAVRDDSTLLVDLPWAGPAVAASAYRIQGLFYSPDPYCWRIQAAWDPLQGVALDVDNFDFGRIMILDPQLTTSDNPTILANMPAAGGGVAQWFLYPPQASKRTIGIMYGVLWPKLWREQDMPPPFINPECFIAGATADVLRVPSITRDAPKDVYFNVELAREYEQQFQEYVEEAERADEPRTSKFLQDYRTLVAGGMSAVYMQTHPGWPSDFGMWPT